MGFLKKITQPEVQKSKLAVAIIYAAVILGIFCWGAVAQKKPCKGVKDSVERLISN